MSSRILINKSFGGFHISDEAAELYRQKSGKKYESFEGFEYKNRQDPILLEIFDELGGKINSYCSEIKAVEIKKGEKYTIFEYDGYETLITEELLTLTAK